MDKKWYKVTFYAEMDDNDIQAMNKYFYETMGDQMEICSCEGLKIELDKELNKEPADAKQSDERLIYVYDDDISLDMKTGEVILFGCDDEPLRIGDYVKLCFMDEVDEPVNKYRVKDVDENDEVFILEFIGTAD